MPITITAPPALSVAMAVYNGGRFLPIALDSILSQSLESFELIVVNDGSTDGTADVLRQYAARDRRVQVLTNDGNRGLLHSRNRAFHAATAPLVAVADADDVFKPNRFEKQVAFMKANPEVGFLGTAGEFIDEDGRVTGTSRLPTEDRHIRFLSLLGGCMWDTSSMYRAELLKSVGYYDPALTGGGLDYDLWTRLMEFTSCRNLDEELVSIRIHRSSMTADLTTTLPTHFHISRRLLSRYLERDVAAEAARDALLLFGYGWRKPLDAGAMARAMEVLGEVRQRAAQRETADTVALYEHRVANALMQQSRRLVRSDRARSLALMAQAWPWSRSAVVNGRLAGHLGRLSVPRALVRVASRLTRG